METRLNILEHALRLFAARGYDAIGVQEICGAAGITKPTLYHHFGNKRGLLAALIQEGCTPFLAHLERAAEYTGDLPLTLQRVAEASFQFAHEQPSLQGLLLALWFAPPSSEAFQIAAAFNDKQMLLLEELFRHAASHHGNMRERHHLYAATFLGTLHTYIALALKGRLVLNEPMAHQAVNQFSHGIYS